MTQGTTQDIGSWGNLKWWESEELKNIQKLLIPGQAFQPSPNDAYNALTTTPLSEVKCVILGQDPYPTPGHATGLAFSVPPETSPLPPTLRNIFKELVSDLHCSWPGTGDLTPWAKQGVLLINTVWTVAPGKPNSHRGLGWEKLTEEVIDVLAPRENIVWVLWGNSARSVYAGQSTSPRPFGSNVLTSAHPSPLSARRGFFGSRPFSIVNSLLAKSGSYIDWRL